jgi:hypothetical protein
MDDFVARAAALLREAGETHHVAHGMLDGEGHDVTSCCTHSLTERTRRT